jgi:hypothetical protein
VSKQDSQHLEPEREAPRAAARRRVAKPYGLKLYYTSIYFGGRALTWKKWYATSDARAKAKARFIREERYEKIEEVAR